MTPKPGVLSSEFWVALAALAAKVITLLVVLNVIKNTDPGQLTEAISAVIAAVGALVTISHGATNYVTNRTNLKTAALKASPSPPVSQIIDTRVGK